MADATASPPRTRAVRRLLWKRLHLPRAVVDPALRGLKRASAPGEVRRRHELARALVGPDAGRVPEATGLLRFGALPGAGPALAECRAARAARAEGAADRAPGDVFNPGKAEFLRAVVSGPGFAALPATLRLMLAPEVLATATRYLGAVPLLAGAVLWWSPPNRSAAGSQLWHCDAEDTRQLKVFVNVGETRAEHGPLTLLPADASAPARARLREGRGRLDDATVARQVPTPPVRLTGPPGSGAFVDTSRCLHFGSRGNTRGRLLLAFQFLRWECPTESTFALRLPAEAVARELGPLQRMALGAP